ncbi:hypothetical protein [Pelagibacterium lentulum]|uniref:Uncharacterized protein n=1 Tax=Pelagibacterium lentulum TaxID=2029865 RepID=A0A916RRX7_9HYPH|nr:hypothetical protein [Pelagibacterium lentulum]GGA64706.1 hypothetical protein GCM10011499_38960 [Pelagibacterium lentulum]
MTDAAGFTDPVDEAANWANELVKRQHRGPGDTVEAAMHRASTKYRIEHQTLWRLRYRKPKDMMLKAYLRLKAAYQAEIERQEAKLAHELEVTKHLRGPNATPSPAEAEADALLAAHGYAPQEDA